jgi:sulfite exporter TauE/SafE
MGLFFTMLPLYLFGNVHCLGMCGPLVMMIGQHRTRYFYFLGRLLSFSLAGMFAGGMGAVSNLFFKQLHLAEAASFIFGLLLIALGIAILSGTQPSLPLPLSRRLQRFNQSLSLLLLKDQPAASFLFGFFTLALPCGQTLVVFSACALTGDLLAGLLNGFAFALLTSPSLFLAMKAHQLMRRALRYYQAVIGLSALSAGLLAVLRGLAELELIPHLILSHAYGLVLY